jgi:hypothetical protein
MVDSENPYASPTSPSVEAELVAAPTEAEEIRRKYLKHEVAIQTVGIFYHMLGAVCALVAGGFAIMWFRITGGRLMRPGDLSSVLAGLGLAIVAFTLGAGLRRLDGRIRIPVIIASGHLCPVSDVPLQDNDRLLILLQGRDCTDTAHQAQDFPGSPDRRRCFAAGRDIHVGVLATAELMLRWHSFGMPSVYGA